MCVSADKYKKIFLIIKKYLKEFLFHKKENNFVIKNVLNLKIYRKFLYTYFTVFTKSVNFVSLGIFFYQQSQVAVAEQGKIYVNLKPSTNHFNFNIKESNAVTLKL